MDYYSKRRETKKKIKNAWSPLKVNKEDKKQLI
jgi:hypothetical protein